MPYRGTTQAWSNRYHFDGAVPTGAAQWDELFDSFQPDAGYLIPSSGSVHEMIGYLAGSDVPVHTKTYDLAGTADYSSTDVPCPGDVAALVRFSTTQRTSKNHPIYLFKYLHQAMHQSGAADTISTAMKLHVDAVMQRWVTGFYTVGGVVVKYCGPNGAVAQDRTTETYLTHRDFPR
jgi:hypothetical protein